MALLPILVVLLAPLAQGRGSGMVEQRAQRWFDLAPLALSDPGWAIDAWTSQGSISHRPCPWGGQLLRLDLRGVPIPGCEATAVQVRPEAHACLPLETSPDLQSLCCRCRQATPCSEVQELNRRPASAKPRASFIPCFLAMRTGVVAIRFLRSLSISLWSWKPPVNCNF